MVSGNTEGEKNTVQMSWTEYFPLFFYKMTSYYAHRIVHQPFEVLHGYACGATDITELCCFQARAKREKSQATWWPFMPKVFRINLIAEPLQ